MAHPYWTRAATLVGVLVLTLTGCARPLLPGLPALERVRLGGSRAGGVPGLEVKLEERFYPVSGVTPITLNGSLARLGPTVRGRKTHAVTEWRVSWSYEPVRRGSACASSRPKVAVSVVTTLPRWMDLEGAPGWLAADWSLFLERLRHHESEHQDIALKSGRDLLAVLDGLEAGDCGLLEEVAERLAASMASNQEAMHQSFDDSTDYGLRRGDG